MYIGACERDRYEQKRYGIYEYTFVPDVNWQFASPGHTFRLAILFPTIKEIV